MSDGTHKPDQDGEPAVEAKIAGADTDDPGAAPTQGRTRGATQTAGARTTVCR